MSDFLPADESQATGKEEQGSRFTREDKMAAIFAQANVGLSEISLAGRFLQVNDELCRILDRPREKILRLGVADVTYPDDLQNSLIAFNQVIETGYTAAIDKRYLRSDGSTVRANSSLSRIDNEQGQPMAVIAVTIDLTARHETEERLREIERHLANAQRLAHLGSWSRDIGSNRLFWSAEMRRIYGLPPEAEVTVELWFNAMHPDDRARVRALIESALAGKDTYDFEYRIIRTDGAQRIIHAVGEVVSDENNVPVRTSGISQDITERRNMEEGLRKSEERLQLSQKLESVGQLAGGIAHDFNNMLTAILGYGDLLFRLLEPDHQLRKYVEEIIKAGTRSAALTQQLLAFSRKQVMQLKPIDLNRLIDDTKNILKRVIAEDIRLIIETDAENPNVMADLGQLTQVVINLVINARDAMPQGGIVTIATTAADLETDLRARLDFAAPGEYLKLTVSDTGTGMDQETLERIFEPFFTTKEVGHGTGLGLATVYGIVKQLKGYITVESEPGEGAIFSIYLPVTAEPEAPEEELNIVLANVRQGAETILLVEDEEAVRALICEILEECGYTVIEAANGLEALSLSELHESKIDLLMTDVVMPEMSGRELAEEIKKILPKLKILFMSGYTDDVVVRHGISEDGINFIQKPFSTDELTIKVRMVLDE